MGGKQQDVRCASMNNVWYALVLICLAVGLIFSGIACAATSRNRPPSSEPVDVNLTLAIDATDADGNPLDVLVTVQVYEGFGHNKQLYRWHTNPYTHEETVSFLGGDPSQHITWNFNGYWEDFSSIRVREYEFWTVDVTLSKTGYFPYHTYWIVSYEECEESGRYGMYWIRAMHERP